MKISFSNHAAWRAKQRFGWGIDKAVEMLKSVGLETLSNGKQVVYKDALAFVINKHGNRVTVITVRLRKVNE